VSGVARRTQQEPEEVVLTDPASVRALAHPARLVVIDALYDGEVLTATECAARAGVSPSAMSYHLRALEKAGLVVRADARGDARERPWKRAGVNLRIDLARKGTAASAAAVAATEVVVVNSLDLDRQRLLAALRADAALPPGAGRASYYARDMLLIGREERDEVAAAVEKALAPYRRANRRDAPEDAVPYAGSFLLAAVRPVQQPR
jgi:DNA-binding transcriptional ArsR family regulator